MSKDLTLVMKRRQTSTRRVTDEAAMCKASICSKLSATGGFSATWVPLPFRRTAAGVQSTSAEAVLSGRHEGSNLPAIDGRSRIGSGLAWMTNADSNPSHQFPILQFKKRQPFGQITSKSPKCPLDDLFFYDGKLEIKTTKLSRILPLQSDHPPHITRVSRHHPLLRV